MHAVELRRRQIPELLRNGLVEHPKADLLLFPMCVKGHWVDVGIYLREEHFDIRFYDSHPNRNLESKIHGQVMPTLKAILSENITWSMMDRPYIQNDTRSSAGYLIENICLDLSPNEERPDLSAHSIRQAHLELLQNRHESNSSSRPKRKDREDDNLPSAKSAKSFSPTKKM